MGEKRHVPSESKQSHHFSLEQGYGTSNLRVYTRSYSNTSRNPTFTFLATSLAFNLLLHNFKAGERHATTFRIERFSVFCRSWSRVNFLSEDFIAAHYTQFVVMTIVTKRKKKVMPLESHYLDFIWASSLMLVSLGTVVRGKRICTTGASRNRTFNLLFCAQTSLPLSSRFTRNVHMILRIISLETKKKKNDF